MYSIVIADEEHSEDIYKIRNNRNVRCNLINHKNISENNHYKWYKEYLYDKKLFMYMICRYEEPIAYFNINIYDGKMEIGFKVLPEYVGKGIGTYMLNKVVKLKELIYEKYECILTVFEDNIEAVNLYNKYKFVEYKRKKINHINGTRVLLYMKLNRNK